MADMDELTQKNAALAEEVNALCDNMVSRAQRMNQALSGFKVQ